MNGLRSASPARSFWCAGKVQGSPWSTSRSGRESWWVLTSPDQILLEEDKQRRTQSTKDTSTRPQDCKCDACGEKQREMISILPRLTTGENSRLAMAVVIQTHSHHKTPNSMCLYGTHTHILSGGSTEHKRSSVDGRGQECGRQQNAWPPTVPLGPSGPHSYTFSLFNKQTHILSFCSSLTFFPTIVFRWSCWTNIHDKEQQLVQTYRRTLKIKVIKAA